MKIKKKKKFVEVVSHFCMYERYLYYVVASRSKLYIEQVMYMSARPSQFAREQGSPAAGRAPLASDAPLTIRRRRAPHTDALRHGSMR